MKIRIRSVRRLAYAGLGLGALLFVFSTRADEVSDWNQNTFTAVFTAGTSPIITTRVVAMVQSAVFDAANVHGKYTPVHVALNAPNGASARAAVVQAAYGILVRLFPAQQAALDAQLAASLANLDEEDDGELSESCLRGLAWGQQVADEIWAWRSTDGFTPAPPPYLGSTDIGKWRPTPPGFLPGAAPQFAYMTPWAIASPSQFRPSGPPALGGAEYAIDLNEVKLMGRNNSTARTPDQNLFPVFWNGNTAGFWNRTALQVAERYDLPLLEKARLLATMDIAMADAIICCWEAKYTYEFWRPVTAIPFADVDGNDATSADPGWLPLIVTPAHPEYPSGHSSASGASAEVLAAFFGDNTEFSVTSELTPGVTRYFSSFSAAVDEVRDARVFGGIHFRSACVDGQNMGRQVANYVLANSVQRVHGH
jgi:PAP2 superfamily protein